MDGKELPATLTADEACEVVGKDKISRGGWYAAINRNEVPHRRLGHRILIPRQAFMRWLETVAQPSEDRRILPRPSVPRRPNAASELSKRLDGEKPHETLR
jgi:excisionase family DNA binding protein